jgi:hypothetical protein
VPALRCLRGACAACPGRHVEREGSHRSSPVASTTR